MEGKVFYPGSDASCPYVLAVGATEWVPPQSAASNASNSTTNAGTGPPWTERATSNFASGGGFSNIFPAPLYQVPAIASYFSRVDAQLNFTGYEISQPVANSFSISNNATEQPPGTGDVHGQGNGDNVGVQQGVFNRAGRGYPDVSAIGDDYLFRFRGGWHTIGGTSLAAPVWGAVLTLLIEERIKIRSEVGGTGKKGRGRLGFVNPLFVSCAHLFRRFLCVSW